LYDFPSFVPDNTLEPPTNLTVALSGDNFENVTIDWDLSLDDPVVGLGENDTTGYDVYYSRVYSAAKSGYKLLASVPSGISTYTHAYAGNGYIGTEWEGKDTFPDNYFYYVTAKDDDWNLASTTEQVGKFIRRLEMGANLISFPLIPIDTSMGAVMQTVSFDKIWHYNTTDIDHWKTYMTFKPYKGDLLNVDNTMGMIVNVTDFSFLTMVGYALDPVQIELQKGWNLISYPSYTKSRVSSVLSSASYIRVEGFDLSADPWHIRLYTDLDFMVPGYAYWVKVTGASTLNVVY
jgi:hypothetical protein